MKSGGFNRKYFLLVFFFLINILSISAQQVIQNGKALYLSNTLIVKVKGSTTLTQLNKTLSKFSITSANEIYPSEDKLRSETGLDILSGIYLVKYNSMENPEILAAKIESMPDILWAEPKYIRRICYSPSDSLFLMVQQDNLIQVHAPGAWDVTKGDEKIVIGIVDVGVDWEHPDLADNIFIKDGSLIPGSDLGGLHGTPDDDPSEDIHPKELYHGTFIAGIASAVTDNKIGVASIGFNSSILPVKVSKDDSRLNGEPLIIYGFEGIKWAVDHGAKIINCSWGGYIYSNYEQSVIDYAIANGALIVGAYGNDSSNTNFYPAAYNGVLSVGWLNTGIGVKTVNPNTNYGRNVKVFAPGSGIYSTWQRPTKSSPGDYRVRGGSSAAAPLVSGLAGLVWSSFPFYTSRQVAERIRVTSDYIDDYNESSYKYLLGHGVINASRAVDKNVKVTSVRADNINFSGSANQEGIFGPGEEVSISIDFTNYLALVDNVTITLTTADNYVTIEDDTFNTGPMDTLTTISNESNEFKFKIAGNAPDNHTIYFLIKYSNGTDYNDFQWISLKITGSYYTSSINNITLTVSSKGTIGFNDYPFNQMGEGFKYRGSENLMFEGAFMYGTGPTKIMNAARIIDRQKQDFIYTGELKTISDERFFYGNTNFSDSGAGTSALGIQINQTSLSFAEAPDQDNYIVLISELNNGTSEDIEQLYAGYFIDWNIPESSYETNTTYFDTINDIAIAYNINNSNSPYTAMSIVHKGNGAGFYAIDNNATSGRVQISDTNGFSDTEKWYALSQGVKEISAGIGDISYVISGGPYNIPAGEEINVEFVIGAGLTLQEAIKAVKTGRKRFGDSSDVVEEPVVFNLDQNYPNPFNSATIIDYKLAEDRMVTLKVYDILGRIVITLVNEFQYAGNYKVPLSAKNNNLSSGVYFYRLTAGSFASTKKMILIK